MPPPSSLQSCSAYEARYRNIWIQLVIVEMPPVCVIRRARAFRGYHRGTQRRERGALLAKGGAVMRFLDPAKNRATDADRRLLRVDVRHFEDAFSIVIAVLGTKPVTAVRDRPHAAPSTNAGFEHAVHQ